MTSSPAGQLKKGETLKALEAKVNADGITRVRFVGRIKGWASVTARGGDVLLRPTDEPEEESELELDLDTPVEDATESESEYTESEAATESEPATESEAATESSAS